jgi:hypothetical protein
VGPGLRSGLVRRRSSTRLGLIAALAALAALVVTPAAGSANYAIAPDGPAVTVEVNNPGATSTATFTGTAGQRVSLNITNVTIRSSTVSLQRNGTNVRPSFTVTRSGHFMDVVTLPADGTYKFLVNPKETYTGQMRLRLYNVPADPVNAITAGGSAVSATTTAPGQNAVFTFTGAANQRVSAEVSSVSLVNGNAKLRLLKPDGSALGTPVSFGGAGAFMEPTTLPVDGPYKLIADPKILATGSFTVQLFDVPADPSVALTPDGASAPVTTTTPGQNAAFTFTAVAGTRYSVRLTGSTFDSAKVSWRRPDGTNLFSPALAVTPSPLETFLNPRTLAAGTHTVFVDPQRAETGSVTAHVFVVPPDLSGSIAFGTTQNAAISKPGQNASYTFTGVKDRRVSLNLANNSYDSVEVSILKPDGTRLFSPALTVTGPGAFLDPIQLPVAGTYRVKVDPVDAATGAIDMTLYDVTADATGTIAANGTPTTIAVNPGQDAKLTFTTSVANQRVAFRVSKGTVSSLRASLDKTGTTTHYFNPTSIGVDPQFLDTKALGPAGGYEIVLDPQGASAGSITVTLWTVPADVTGPLNTGSNSVTLSLGQNARLTFSGTAGQTATISLSSGTIAEAWARLLPSSGTSALTSEFWNPSLSSNPSVTKVLPATGTYTFLLDPVADKSGSMTFTLSLS